MATRKVIELRSIDHVVLRVRNVDESLRFYCDILGCTLEKVQKELGLFQLRAGASLIDLVTLEGALGAAKPSPPQPDAPNLDHFCVQVKNWNATSIQDFLRNEGIDPGDVQQRYGAEGYGPSLYIRDPDGNTVELKGPPS